MKNLPEVCGSRNILPNKHAFTVNSRLKIRSWSPDMELLCRKSKKNVIGSKINEFFPLLDEKITRVFSAGRKKSIANYKINCFAGNTLTANVQMTPLRNRRGMINEVLIELDHISGGCQLNKELHNSEKMAAIGKIASSLAHGVRNPLNAIKGAIAYLREKYGHETTLLEFSTIINEEIDRLDYFISSFLSASKEDMKFGSVDINDLVTSIIVMIKPRAEIQGVNISKKISDLPLIHADVFQIEQAFFNIINNALEALPDGGEINIKTSLKWEKDHDYVVIEISDTGKGIPEEKLKQLGELSGNSGDNDRGFGIFLSREIIKSHNGKLLWESSRDRGTTFKIFLPVRQIGKTE